jgi:DsbC/DsbD-like thiol-disulfide interchange protein
MPFVVFLCVLSLLQLPQPPKHLTIAATASAATAAPGSKVSLFLDITPNPGIHVYAPGAKDYLPIAVTIDPHPGVTVGAVKYPKSDTMVFDGERVPVYQKAFRLVDEVSLASSLKTADTMTLTGTVKYQACDDRVCFFPASVPVAWTIKLKSGAPGKSGGSGKSGKSGGSGKPGGSGR